MHGYLVPAWFIDERFRLHQTMPFFSRFDKIANDVEQNVGIYYHYDITTAERAELKAAIRKMFCHASLRQAYKDFFQWMDRPELFKTAKHSVLEYADVFPLIYLKTRYDGLKPRDYVKHLLIDEMQDYTPVQYAVLAKIFPCHKTILGDAGQLVNPLSSSRAETIREVFSDSACVRLCRSYRSTREITAFA